MRTITRSAFGATFALVLLSGCSTSTDTPAPSSPTESGSPSSTSDASDAPSDDDGADEESATPDPAAALDAAADAVSGKPYDMEHETRDDGTQVWEIKVAVDGAEHKLDVTLDGSAILSKHQSDKPDDDVAKVESVSMSAKKALAAVTAQHDGKLDELEIDTHHGAIAWEVTLKDSDGNETEYAVDPESGEVSEVTD